MNVESLAQNPGMRVLENFKRNWITMVQLLLVVAVVHLYQIEGGPFEKVITLASLGFLINTVLPLAQRLPFFVVLSIIGIFWVLGVTDGAFIILLGLLLIGIIKLPIPMKFRVLLLIVSAILLAVLRSGYGEVPWSSAMWPIFGSMFMFRTVLYVRAVNLGHAESGLLNALAYFFMLPNVAFPLFPVVDYQTFQRTHFDREETEIYEQGMLWISRGLVHLVLYRYIYYYVLNDPRDVVLLSDLAQYMLGTLLLYLKVSGQFHIITGILHLFGFRLPETHKLYYLAHSFTELWRRINIYWTEFMMKAVFYPTYFKVKKFGPARALVLSTTVVFLTTWILHSYQWFWLRGGFPVTIQDMLFWSILGTLVVIGALKELKTTKKTRQKTTGWNWRMGVRAATTFMIFCFLWSLWSTESFGQWIWLIGAASNVDGKGVALILAAFGIIMLLGGWDWQNTKPTNPLLLLAREPSVRTFTPLLVLLLLAQPGLQQGLLAEYATTLESLQTARLNKLDAAAQHRGYYEQLDIRDRLANAPDTSEFGELRDQWETPASAGIIRERDDRLSRDLKPSYKVLWNGNEFSTNQYGMRDRDYSITKPAGTLRIAFMGPSHVMGNGVSDSETFENLVEDELNRNNLPDGYDSLEILNFGVDGYSMPQQLALLEDRVFDFSPDIVIFTVYHQTLTMTESYLDKMVLRNIPVGDEKLHSIFSEAGLNNIDHGTIPVAYQSARNLVKKIGLSPRMPAAELDWRIHQISQDVDNWAIQRMSSITKEHGAEPVMLALDVVLDVIPEEIPNRAAIEQSGMHFINLFDVFSGKNLDQLRVAPWDDHPNSAGHRLIADQLYDELVPLLNTIVSGRNFTQPDLQKQNQP